MTMHSIAFPIVLSFLHTLSHAEPSPQYPSYHNPPPPQNPFSQRRDSFGSFPFNQQQNFSAPNPQYLTPATGPAAADVLNNLFGRQFYNPPPPMYPQGPAYLQPGYPQPQIYKVDNLIIITTPPPQPQPCAPQRPLYPRPTPGDDDVDVDDRFGTSPDRGPSRCTWAIVACCSPNSNAVRYNCFELLGCPGFFFDNSPCDPKIVMAAAKAALDFYSKANNGTNNGGSGVGGTSSNQI